MNDVSYPVDLEALSERLLEIARAQADALRSDDWAAFDRLCIERDDLQGLLDGTLPEQTPPPILDRLQATVATDLMTTDLIRRLASETSAEAEQVQHVHAALRSYGRPAAEIPPSTIDAQR